MNPLAELDDYDAEPDIYQADGPVAGGGRDVVFCFVGAFVVGRWVWTLA